VASQPTDIGGRAGAWPRSTSWLGAGASRALLARGVIVIYLSLVVLIPLAAVAFRATDGGAGAYWRATTNPAARSALQLSVTLALAVAAINAVVGTLLAWVLTRDAFRGQSVMNALIDLPFALPTIVAGLTLLALYGPRRPLGVNVAYTRFGVGLALLFVTLPFVVRAVQPVLAELDREMEEAAAALGAGTFTIFRRIILPNLTPAILSGAALGFARALGEFGSVALISGNIPLRTQVASVQIYSQVESDNVAGAAADSDVLMSLSNLEYLGGAAMKRLATPHAR
jgi:sulfate transport system permease protein